MMQSSHEKSTDKNPDKSSSPGSSSQKTFMTGKSGGKVEVKSGEKKSSYSDKDSSRSKSSHSDSHSHWNHSKVLKKLQSASLVIY